MFRSTAVTRIDEKGRLKMPARFRSVLLSEYGPELFLTSIIGSEVRIYPLQEWMSIEDKVRKGPRMDPRVQRFMRRVNYFGETLEMDPQGRLLIPQRLREHANTENDVIVIGYPHRYLEVWNQEAYVAQMKADPLTAEDLDILSQQLGI